MRINLVAAADGMDVQMSHVIKQLMRGSVAAHQCRWGKGCWMFDAAFYDSGLEVSRPLNGHLPSAPARSRAKRLLDICVALTLLAMLLPAFLFIACYIRAESYGPVLFRQRRGGLLGRSFTVFQFRTMSVMEDGEDVIQASKRDSRVTPFGRLLRRTSLDELPQLINVLKGEMSLVGPRPHAVAHDEQFQERLPAYARRFALKPGITGLAQVRGYRGETTALESLERRVASDIEYMETRTFWADLKLLVATLKVPLDRNAY